MFEKKFPFYKQLNENDCGAACFRIVAMHYGKSLSAEKVRLRTQLNTRQGANMETLSTAAEKLHLRTLAARVKFDKLVDLPMPLIAHWQQKHYIVVYKIRNNKVYVSDPAYGLITYSEQEFKKGWASLADDNGIVLLLEPSSEFYAEEDRDETEKKIGFRYFVPYLFKYKKYFYQLMLGTLIGNVLQLIAPFLTQAVVDYGIINQDIGFINTMLIAQLMLTLSSVAYSFISTWIGLHVGSRIGLAIISDFIAKLMRLPMAFFDTKTTGDILQRLGDHGRVTGFLSSSTIGVFFSLLNLVVYGTYMALYSVPILVVFVIGTIMHAGWVFLFLKARKDMDYKGFHLSAQNETAMIELVNGIQEIKLNNVELQKRWDWERIQAKIFKLSIKRLVLNQNQEAGAMLISQVKNILITYLTAKAVIDGELSLGMMLAIQFIIGQLNAPFAQFIGLIQSAQDAKIGLERLGEIHNRPDEDSHPENMLTILPAGKDIEIKDLEFSYEGNPELVLKNINLNIPYGTTIAIVGKSGSGKTTLLKLLLKYYLPTKGEIKIGGAQLNYYASGPWRKKCGVIMQEGYLFADTIARNIAVGEDIIDREKLIHAVKVANIQEYIEGLPLAYNTRLGKEGQGLSQGQKQRMLIARSIYKEPDYFFFDEATNALDSTNESIIMKNLETNTAGKTVIIVAHRLSTVKHADHIIVMEKGRIIEEGTHQTLTKDRGEYFNLVSNQLELGA
jgi:ATP-binding cassette subfamily B protein